MQYLNASSPIRNTMSSRDAFIWQPEEMIDVVIQSISLQPRLSLALSVCSNNDGVATVTRDFHREGQDRQQLNVEKYISMDTSTLASKWKLHPEAVDDSLQFAE